MEAALTLNDWIRSLNDGGLAPSSDQLVNSIQQYYSNQPTPREYMINDKMEALFRESNICDLRKIFSTLFPEKQKGIMDEIRDTNRVKAIFTFEADKNRNEINFTFNDKLSTIMQILRRRQQHQRQRGDLDESSCVLQGGRIRRQMKKKSKRVKVKRSTRRRLSKRHSHHKK